MSHINTAWPLMQAEISLQAGRIISCMDPDGGHESPEQYAPGLPATCVTAEQYDSMPRQDRCVSATGDDIHLGMDLIWQFMSRYRTDNR